MNYKGEKTGLFIDPDQLKHEGTTETNVMEFMEGLEDILAIELSKKENNYNAWEHAKNPFTQKKYH